MALSFLKKGVTSTGKGYAPVDRVRELTGKGFSEMDVIDVLRREGFSPEEIDKAFTQTIKENVTNTTQPSSEKLPTLEDIAPPPTPIIPETSLPEGYYQSQQYQTEDYIDYVVQERMRELSERFVEFSVKTNELEKRIDDISKRVDGIMRIRSTEQTQLITKIDSFKESVGEIEMRISSLEKAFKETLPALIESVRSLSDLVQRFKKEA